MLTNEPLPGMDNMTYNELVQMNARANENYLRHYAPDVRNEWTPMLHIEYLAHHIVNGASLPPEFTTKLDCDDGVVLKMMCLQLSGMRKSEQLRRLWPT